MIDHKAYRWVEFINFTPDTLREVQEEWKVIPQVETIDPEEKLACFELAKYVPKDKDNPLDVASCNKHNNDLADFTMRRLKETINKKCPGLYFSLKKLTIRKL